MGREGLESSEDMVEEKERSGVSAEPLSVELASVPVRGDVTGLHWYDPKRVVVSTSAGDVSTIEAKTTSSYSTSSTSSIDAVHVRKTAHLSSLHGDTGITGMDISSAHGLIATAGGDGTISLISMETQTVLRRFDNGTHSKAGVSMLKRAIESTKAMDNATTTSSSPTSTASSSTSTTSSSSSSSLLPSSSVSLASVISGPPIPSRLLYTGTVAHSIRFAPSHTFISAGESGKVYQWDLRSSLLSKSQADALSATTSTNSLASSLTSNTSTGLSFASFSSSSSTSSSSSSSFDATLVSLGLSPSPILSITDPLRATITATALHPSRPYLLAIGTEDGRVCCYDTRLPSSPLSSILVHAGAVTDVQFVPWHPSCLLTTSIDGALCIIDYNKVCIPVIVNLYSNSPVYTLNTYIQS